MNLNGFIFLGSRSAGADRILYYFVIMARFVVVIEIKVQNYMAIGIAGTVCLVVVDVVVANNVNIAGITSARLWGLACVSGLVAVVSRITSSVRTACFWSTYASSGCIVADKS